MDNAEKLRAYIRTKEPTKPRAVPGAFVFRLAAAAAACLVFAVTIAYITSKNLPKEPTKETLGEGEAVLTTEEMIVVYGEIPDPYIAPFQADGGFKITSEACISPLLKEKMKSYESANAVYRVFVELIITPNDIKNAPFYEDSGSAFDHESIPNVESYQAYFGEIIDQRLEEASHLSRIEPKRPSSEDEIKLYHAYQEQGYYMELTAEQIEALVQKGGYVFKLAQGE
ncbi:MAG: hypothetical protein J6R89_07035 [Clostridia bacterium]|nr:hypothetical protein [Clostridia bacterium]